MALHHLVAATKIAGLTYRLVSTTTLLGLLLYGTFEFVKQQRNK